MNCEELLAYLSDYINDNLDEELVTAAQEHLSTCQNCSIVLDSTQRTIALGKAQQRGQQMSPQRQARLYSQLAAAFEKRSDQS